MKSSCAFSWATAVLIASLGVFAAQPAVAPAPGLTALVDWLATQEDPDLQLDVLRGMSEGLKGRRGVTAPARWEDVANQLRRSRNAEVRELAASLSVIFGSASALASLRETLGDAAGSPSARSNALDVLLQARDATLPPLLQTLLSDTNVQRHALRGLAAFDDPKTPAAILRLYPGLDAAARTDALMVLSSRPSFARALLEAITRKQIAARDLTADVLRQLRNIRDPQINEQVAQLWGVARETDEEKLHQIERFSLIVKRKGYGNAARGRAVYDKLCAQCHALFGEGGTLGPELTGGNRTDIEYVLQNIIDPNALIPNDYRTWNMETKDDRSITGIVTKQDAHAVTIVTANETLVIPRSDIASLDRTELSMMPEGLLQAFSDDDVRDLIAYLRSPSQVAAPPDPR